MVHYSVNILCPVFLFHLEKRLNRDEIREKYLNKHLLSIFYEPGILLNTGSAEITEFPKPSPLLRCVANTVTLGCPRT
jgi:hypothetical protein